MREPKLMLILAQSLIGTGFFFLYIQHVRSIFASRTNIVTRTQMERETMLLRRDDALYYSFFKTIVESSSFEAGYEKLQNISGIEYPRKINVMSQFYVLPELVIGYAFHFFRGYPKIVFDHLLSCWRSNDMQYGGERCDMQSQAMQFYLECVWLFGGFTVLTMYLYGTLLSENVFGGIYAVISYIMFHSFASKIYERPMARENFAFPIIFMQMLYLSTCIQKVNETKEYNSGLWMSIKLMFLSTIALMCWQFSSIIFATQTIIMMSPWGLSKVPEDVSNRFNYDYAVSQLLSIASAFYLTHGNPSFLYTWQLGPAVAGIVLCLARRMKQVPTRTGKCEFQTICLGIFMAISAQGSITDLMEKLSVSVPSQNSFALYRDLLVQWALQAKVNFTTSLTACNPDYERMDVTELWDLVKTLIIKPYCMYGVVMLAKFFRKWRKSSEKKTPSNELIERSKNYVLEDFMEENHISMQDMSNKNTEEDLNECLKLLEQCDYDYDKYKLEKRKLKSDKSNDREDFINQLKELKEEINKKQQQDKENAALAKNSKEAEPPTYDEAMKTADNSNLDTNDLKNESKSTTNTTAQNNEQSNGSSRRVRSNKNSSTSTTKTKNVKANNSSLGAAAAAAENGIKPDSDICSFHYIYSFAQMMIFTIIGLGVKKLFFLTFSQGCVIVPTICSKLYYRKQHNVFWTVSLAVFMTSLVSPGMTNIRDEYFPSASIRGNEDLDSMVEWIKMNTERDAVFAGPIDIIGTVHLTTRRPIVNNAHLELRQLSDRTEYVYSVYSRQQSSDIYNQYSQLKIQYLIISLKDCSNEIKNECSLLQLWDDMQPAYRKYPQFCSELATKNIPSFLKVYANEYYGIIKMFSQSVQLNLKYSKMPEKVM